MKPYKTKAIEDLRGTYPVLAEQLVQGEIDDLVAEEVRGAVGAERQRIISLVAVHCGRASAEKILKLTRHFDGPEEKITSKQQKEIAMFESAVSQYMAENGCSKAQAIAAVAKQQPDLHKDFVSRAQNGQAKPIKTFTGSGKATCYEELVSEYRKKYGCSLAEAIKVISQESPELYQDYQQRAKAGNAKKFS